MNIAASRSIVIRPEKEENVDHYFLGKKKRKIKLKIYQPRVIVSKSIIVFMIKFCINEIIYSSMWYGD